MSKEKIAIIVYGDGAELGDFSIFAKELKREIAGKYKKIILKYLNRDTAFYSLIGAVSESEEIGELHIFSHAMGAGIFLGYKDPSVAAIRRNYIEQASRLNRRVTYLEAVNAEVGAIQTDDFFSGPRMREADLMKSKFAKSAFIKLWGCNSGVANWVYSDTNAAGNSVVDPADSSAIYYWRAFNERNVPKPSIASAFAKYYGVRVYGAHSGASIEVKKSGNWMSSQKYKDKAGHWPSGVLPHRLEPDKGTYHEYLP